MCQQFGPYCLLGRCFLHCKCAPCAAIVHGTHDSRMMACWRGRLDRRLVSDEYSVFEAPGSLAPEPGNEEKQHV